MFNQRIKAGVFGNDMKKAGRVGRSESTKVIGDMEIESVGSRCFEPNVLTSITKLLHCKYELNGKFCVVWPKEDAHSKLLSLEKGE